MRRHLFLIAALGLLAGAGSLSAQDGSTDELHHKLSALQAEVAQLKARDTPDARLAELERRIDLLAAEIEESRTGGATVSEVGTGAKGFAPAASKVYRTVKGISIGGYGEALYENAAAENQSGAPSGRTDQFDFLRAVLYFGYKFSDRILLNSELEFEHASTGKGGEASVEFAYLEYELSRQVGLRAGMLLVPVGFVNELHEPPVFHGARRPEVETAVLPSTWRENGLGLYGESGPVQWRAYALAGLNSAGFTAAGLRGGRQSGARSKAEDLAFTGRIDVNTGGLLAGAAFFTGGSGQGAKQAGQAIGGRLTVYDLHGQFERGGLQLRGLYARSQVQDVALINLQNSLTGNKSVGEAQVGWYLQAAFDVMTLRSPGSWSVSPFVRYEQLDTQVGVPAGFSEDPATDRRVVTAGLSMKPVPNVALKVDYQRFTNKAKTGVSQFNLAVGYLF